MSRCKRCFICDLQADNTFIANSACESVRIIGVLVSVESATDDQIFPMGPLEKDSSQEVSLFTVDDGTALVDIWTPISMVASYEPGQTLELIARLRQNPKVKRWYADTIIIVTDSDTEYLRWIELSHPPNPNESRRFGFPVLRRNENEAFRLICVQNQMDPSSGVSLKDLALVMQTPTSKMQEMIQRLQLTGQIYQNHKGEYVPL